MPPLSASDRQLCRGRSGAGASTGGLRRQAAVLHSDGLTRRNAPRSHRDPGASRARSLLLAVAGAVFFWTESELGCTAEDAEAFLEADCTSFWIVLLLEWSTELSDLCARTCAWWRGVRLHDEVYKEPLTSLCASLRFAKLEHPNREPVVGQDQGRALRRTTVCRDRAAPLPRPHGAWEPLLASIVGRRGL
jgi:hypothetical protein